MRLRSRLIPVLLTFAVLAMGQDDCGSSTDSGGDDSGSGSSNVADAPTGDAEGRGECPRQAFVGLPIDLELNVTNTGDKVWPVTYFTIDDGADHFVFNNAHMGPLVAQKVDTPAFDTWQLGKEARD